VYLYVIFSLLSLLAFADIFTSPSQRTPRYTIVFVFTIFLLFILSSLRVERGTDWGSYELYFDLSTWDFEGWMEPGFTLLNKLVYACIPHFVALSFCISLFIYLLKPQIIYRFSPYPFVALLAWYVITLADIFPVRQTLASAILLYSIRYVIEKRFFPFLLLVILASSIHATSIVFFITYFVFYRRFSRLFLLSIFVGSFVFAFVAEGFMGDLLSGINNEFIQERIEKYLSVGVDETFGSVYSTQGILIRGFLNRSIIMFMVLSVMNSLRKEDCILNGWVNLFTLASILFAVFASVNVALGRISVFFDMSQIFLFSYFFKWKMTPMSRFILFGLLLVYFGYRFYGVINNYYDLYVPYKSLFWNIHMPVLVG